MEKHILRPLILYLDPHDDEDDDIRFEMAFPTDQIKLGDYFVH